MAARQPPPSSASAPTGGLSMKEYLKRYQSGPGADGDQKKAKKKTKKKPKPAAGGGGVLIVDEDPVWQKPVRVEDDEPASSGDDRPLVDEDIEVKRMRRLEAIRAVRPYNAIAEDGSGWVTVAAPEEQGGGSTRRRRNDTPSPERGGAGSKDFSPPRRRQRRDTPSPEPGDAAGKDMSPPRQRRRRQDTPSPKGNGAADQDDMSPPRKPRRQQDPSPLRRRARNDSEEPQDLELPRRRVRHDSEEPQDMSPPRRRMRHDSEEPQDMSLPRRRRHDSEEPQDMSPPRRRMRHDSEEPQDMSPPRRRMRHDSEEPQDLSVPRRRAQHDLEEPKHISQPRRQRRHDSEEPKGVPPQRRKHQDSTKVDDLSPPRRRNMGQNPEDGDFSPPRKGKKEGAQKQARKAGLMTAEEVKEDIRKIKEDEMLKFAAQDPSLVGKGAKAVFRDKEGKRISEEEMRKSKESEKPKEIHIEWGKGLAQKREAEARLKELEAEKSKPFARTRDDPELDSMLKNRIRWGDPMAHLVKDNVFVQLICTIQYRVVKEHADDAFYELQNPQQQIQAYVFDVVRAIVPRMNLDDLFEQKNNVAKSVLEELEKVMADYGYSIEHILMVDIIPDAAVRKAMNEINAAQRLQLASVYKGEAEKILLVKKAEAEAEAKYLSGVGIAKQRQAITDGLRENILNFSHSVSGTSAKEVMDLIMVTQYFDTIKELGDGSKNTTVFIPHGPGHVKDISEQIRDGMMQASSSNV